MVCKVVNLSVQLGLIMIMFPVGLFLLDQKIEPVTVSRIWNFPCSLAHMMLLKNSIGFLFKNTDYIIFEILYRPLCVMVTNEHY